MAGEKDFVPAQKVSKSAFDAAVMLRDVDTMYSTLAERHAYAMGWMDGWFQYDKSTGETAKNWPNAYSKGYWEGKNSNA